MLPAYWPLLVLGVVAIIAGAALSVRAYSVAHTVANVVHGAPPVLATLLLVRPRPKSHADTTKYLGDIYRVVGVGWIALGLIMLVAVFFGKPAPPIS